MTRTPLSRSKSQKSTCKGRAGAYCGGLPHRLFFLCLWLTHSCTPCLKVVLRVLLLLLLLLHCALASCGAVYCNRSCLWVCDSGRAGSVCYHNNSIFTELGEGSDHLQLIKSGRKFLAPRYYGLRAVFASLRALFSSSLLLLLLLLLLFLLLFLHIAQIVPTVRHRTALTARLRDSCQIADAQWFSVFFSVSPVLHLSD